MAIFPLRAIYFHCDFDGIVSAAMLVRHSSSNAELFPVDYHLRSQWSRKHLLQPAAVVDFLFHPQAAIWFDHHADPFVVASWREHFHPDQQKVWDTQAPCCPTVLARHLHLTESERGHFSEYILWASIIDAAQYGSAQEATDLTNPYILLSHAIGLLSENTSALGRVVNLVAQADVKTVLEDPQVSNAAASAAHMQAEIKTQLPTRIRYTKMVAEFDQSDKDWPYQRYFPYLAHPETNFVVGIYKGTSGYKISVGANPWKHNGLIHLGDLCKQYGGGGHANVGGISVVTIGDARALASLIAERLRDLAGDAPKAPA